MNRSPLLSLLTLCLLFVLPACDVEVEGDEAGECDDGVDNDQDGDTDCSDDSCANATACTGDDDDAADDDDAGPDAGALDLSELPAGNYGEEYSGRIRVEDYGGAVSMTQTGGGLPPGLAMDEAGRVTGTPTYAGQFIFEVLSSGMEVIDDFTADATIVVTADDVEGAFLGYDHDQLNNFDNVGGRMRDIWLRISGTGEDQFTYTINPGVYLAGPNGANDRGRGDDVRIGDVSVSSLEWDLADWVPTNDPVLHEYEPDIFSQHVPEGDPPVIDTAAGTFSAGVDGGEQDIQFTHPVYGTVDTRLMVTAPDWCPKGEHEGGWTEGICE